MGLKKGAEAGGGLLRNAVRAVAAPFAGAMAALGALSSAADRCGMQAVLSAKPLLRLYAFFAIGGAAAIGAQLVEAKLSRTPDYEVDVRSLEIQERPLWLDADWVASIRNPFGDRKKVNIFEADVVARIHGSFSECPWIEQVCYVRKEFPNRLSVKIKVRAPAVAIWEKDSYVLVDRDGVVLPRRFKSVPDFGFSVFVADAPGTRAPAPGCIWDDSCVKAAVAMADLIRGSSDPVLGRVARIDASAASSLKPGRTEIVLYAREGGGRIEWGASPAKKSPLEIPVEKKIENVRKLFAAYPDMREVDYALVQFKDVYVLPRNR